MMRSVVPVYPPSGSDVVRAGSLPGEPSPVIPNNTMDTSKFLQAFDVDESGGISFDEWLVFQALLAIPDDDVQGRFVCLLRWKFDCVLCCRWGALWFEARQNHFKLRF